jgi:hypothetical protein
MSKIFFIMGSFFRKSEPLPDGHDIHLSLYFQDESRGFGVDLELPG